MVRIVRATEAELKAAVTALREGDVVAFPTETVYGLGADAFNPAAIDRVFALKGRPRNNPLIVHVSGPEMAAKVARVWTAEADLLARQFWPGPLSILVPRRADLPEAVTARGDLVAVRCPNHPVTLALLFELGRPLVGPSANISGQVSPTTAAHVRSAFAPDEVFVLDGGPCDGGIESTVVDLTSTPARILRPGLISAEQIAESIGRAVIAAPKRERADADAPLASPGLLDRHYAPTSPTYLFSPTDWPSLFDTQPAAVVITHRMRHVDPPHHLIEMPPLAEHYAAMLYAALREADSRRPSAILIERPPADSPLWLAIADRLSRAATPWPSADDPPRP